MKIRQRTFHVLVLFLILLITGCSSDSTTPVADSITPVTDRVTAVADEVTPVADSVIPTSTQEATTTSPNVTTDSEATEVTLEVTNVSQPQATEVPENTAETEETTQVTPTFAATATLLSPGTVEPTYPPAITTTPEVQAFVTPKARSQWRAGSGELFIRFDNGVKNFQYYLYVPEDWWGIFEMRQDSEEGFLFNYIGNPDTKTEVFRVHAYREDVWKEKQANGDPGVEFYDLRGVTFVYYVAQDNPFEDEEAEIFQSMIDDIPEIINDELEIVSRRFNEE